MLKIYVLIIVIGIVGGIGYGAKYFYDTTQQTIATLRENNSKLEVAVNTANQSIELMKAEAIKQQKLMDNLSKKLKKAEAYGDELRNKLSRINLVVEALRDAKVLEGKMNGATAKLWRGFMGDTGNDIGSKSDLPEWLQPVPTGTGDKGSDKGGKDNSTNSGETQTSPAN